MKNSHVYTFAIDIQFHNCHTCGMQGKNSSVQELAF